MGSQRKPYLLHYVAGASGGTLVLRLIQDLPDTFTYKQILILLAPTIAVMIAGIWRWIINKNSKASQKRELEKIFKEADDILYKRLTNAKLGLSAEELKEVRETYVGIFTHRLSELQKKLELLDEE